MFWNINLFKEKTRDSGMITDREGKHVEEGWYLDSMPIKGEGLKSHFTLYYVTPLGKVKTGNEELERVKIEEITLSPGENYGIRKYTVTELPRLGYFRLSYSRKVDVQDLLKDLRKRTGILRDFVKSKLETEADSRTDETEDEKTRKIVASNM